MLWIMHTLGKIVKLEKTYIIICPINYLLWNLFSAYQLNSNKKWLSDHLLIDSTVNTRNFIEYIVLCKKEIVLDEANFKTTSRRPVWQTLISSLPPTSTMKKKQLNFYICSHVLILFWGFLKDILELPAILVYKAAILLYLYICISLSLTLSFFLKLCNCEIKNFGIDLAINWTKTYQENSSVLWTVSAHCFCDKFVFYQN